MADVLRFAAEDGARLAYRDDGQGLALLCLPGLTRTTSTVGPSGCRPSA